ncbi:hypothetical protein KL86PLE_90048 [uncultured Pleomorphomonas sp.]|uniref:Uncharacterized protein n=1 Tax=uncultured Pleomorphomonas sp. TaxID=442121 RepID=A0A212LMG9_9HYPH|nr:hypothetical protein [uncultured Pleomorphomonas sp.]SCM78723.1 hypothetical protein KL86PLE_90048 [uncultured Pleomorphomonas sp.]
MLSLKLSAPLIGLFSAGLLCLGLYGMSVESAPFLSTAGTVADRLQSVAADPDVPFLSSKRALGVFDLDCRRLAFDQTAETIPFEDRPRLNDACYERAKSMVAAAPGNAILWLTLARFAATDADRRDTTFRALELSRAYGPWQYALATDRMQLIALIPDTPPAIKAIVDADIATLAASYRGREDLAKLYIAMPDRRDQITAAIEKRPAGQQNQFLSRIRRNMQ